VDAGITFIGPSAAVLEMAGNKATAVAAAAAAGVPVLRSNAPSADVPTLIAAAEKIGFPVFVKAVAAGGGMRRVETRDALPEALATVMREADSAFGTPPCSWSERSSTRVTSRCRSWPTTAGASATRRAPFTCSSGTARCSGGTRR
jgi:pyruvate carboxylase